MPAKFDPTPEDAAELRERLLKAGEQRASATSAAGLRPRSGTPTREPMRLSRAPRPATSPIAASRRGGPPRS